MTHHSTFLRTPRLLLSRPEAADAGAVFALLSDPRALTHNPSDRMANLDETVDLVARWRGHWEQHGFGYCCLRTSPDSEVIGYSGVKTVRFRGEEALNLVYRLAPGAWGQGLASEAASAVVNWVGEHVPARRVLARVRPENLASQRVATKAGLVRVPEWDEEGYDGMDLVFTDPLPTFLRAGGGGPP